MKTGAQYLGTALAEIIGCYLPWRWLNQSRSAWLLLPAAASLTTTPLETSKTGAVIS